MNWQGMYDRKRKILYEGLKKAGFRCQLPEGAYYIITDISGFGRIDGEFARFLVEKIGVAAVPGSSFYNNGGHSKLRFTFSKKDETLHEACRRLEQLDHGLRALKKEREEGPTWENSFFLGMK